ncbi:unnamed protein product [Calypogeia fissa]
MCFWWLKSSCGCQLARVNITTVPLKVSFRFSGWKTLNLVISEAKRLPIHIAVGSRCRHGAVLVQSRHHSAESWVQGHRVEAVGHSIAGVTISFVMEQYPEKISHAIFLAASMPANNKSQITSIPPFSIPRLLAQQVSSIMLTGQLRHPHILRLQPHRRCSILLQPEPRYEDNKYQD